LQVDPGAGEDRQGVPEVVGHASMMRDPAKNFERLTVLRPFRRT
jgi:hypothetical protein